MISRYRGNNKIYGMYHKIINEIPPFKTYWELFGGSAQIAQMIFRPGDEKYIINELNKTVTDQYDFITPQHSIRNDHAKKVMDELKLRSGMNDFVFCDPPYLHETRPNCTKLYEYEMSDHSHVQFLINAKMLPCKTMILHPVCDLYEEMLSGWRKVEMKVRYTRKTSIQRLYMNYEKPTRLFCDKFTGEDSWDRQRIKRKTEAYVKYFTKLPPLERNFILDRLNQIK